MSGQAKHPQARALIFDFDGLIVDTETPLFDSWQRLYEDHGHQLTLETYVQCVGSTTQQFDPIIHLQNLVNSEPRPSAAAIEAQHRQHVSQQLKARDTLPGVRERISEAQDAGLQLALASSSPSEWIDPWLERLGLTEHFHVVRTRDHVSEAKPSPELFLSAAHHLNVSPEEAVVFEDSHHGLQAARAAKMRCVAIPNPVTKQSDFTEAHLVLSSMADLMLHEILNRLGSH